MEVILSQGLSRLTIVLLGARMPCIPRIDKEMMSGSHWGNLYNHLSSV